MTKIIEFSQQERTFFGFYVSDKAMSEENFLILEPDGFALYTGHQKVTTLNWFDHFFGKGAVSPKKVWSWIFAECRKFVDGKIYIPSDFAVESDKVAEAEAPKLLASN